jgi:regulator of ribonuclease activity A
MMATADLCDAHEDAWVVALPLTGYGGRRAFEGRVRTVRCFEDFGLTRRIVDEPGEGCVLVVDGGGSVACAIFGATMAAIAARNGWSGLVFNGAVRDAAELAALDIGVKALGLHPRRGGRQGSGEVDVAVQVGGVRIEPGQWLAADEDGVVVLPRKPLR